MYPVNQVLMTGEIRRRLIWCDAELAVWIDIDSPTALPEPIPLVEFERQLLDGSLLRIDDPFLNTTLREVSDGSVDQQKRDSAWEILADVVQDTRLLERRARGEIVKGIMELHGITNQTVYRLLRRYWQRGMSRNALLPDYVNSGEGKTAKTRSSQTGQAKSGKGWYGKQCYSGC